MNRYDRRARRGATWLDFHADPHWPKEINLSSLDLSSRHRCVLGQVFDFNSHGLSGFEYGLTLGSLLGFWPFRGGFICFPSERAHRRQTDAWVRLLSSSPKSNPVKLDKLTVDSGYQRDPINW